MDRVLPGVGGTLGYIEILDRAVPLDTSNHNLSIRDVARQEYCNRDLEDAKTVGWALGAALSDRVSARNRFNACATSSW